MKLAQMIHRVRMSARSTEHGTRVIFGHEVLGVLGHDDAGGTIYAVTEPGTSKICALKHALVRRHDDQKRIERLEAEHRAGLGFSHDGLRPTTGLYVRRSGSGRVTQAALLMQM